MTSSGRTLWRTTMIQHMNRPWITACAVLALVFLTAGLPAVPLPHLITEIIRDSRDNVIGYKVHHEVELVPYVAMLAPDAMALESCRLDDIQYLEIFDGDGLPTFTGSDGRQCPLAKFKPDVLDPYEKLPPKEEPRGECPSCPGG